MYRYLMMRHVDYETVAENNMCYSHRSDWHLRIALMCQYLCGFEIYNRAIRYS